jgi:hypothetical protein
MSTTRRHYTFEDIEDALEDQRAELAIWRSEALRELRKELTQGPVNTFRAVSGKDGASK